jgi:hypothetical protein
MNKMDKLVGNIVWFELGSFGLKSLKQWGFIHAISENEKYVYIHPFDNPAISHGLHVRTRGDWWGVHDDK